MKFNMFDYSLNNSVIMIIIKHALHHRIAKISFAVKVFFMHRKVTMDKGTLM